MVIETRNFFQAVSSERAKRNKITTLHAQDGSLITSQEGIETAVTEFYQNLFSTQDNLEPEEILLHVPRRVTDEMNEILSRPYTADEVRQALFMMGPNKAPWTGWLHCRLLPTSLGSNRAECYAGCAAVFE